MSIVVRLSDPDTDVKTARAGQTRLDDRYPIQKIAFQGTGTITLSAGGTNSATITHNLGYEPQVLLYAERTPGAVLQYVDGQNILINGVGIPTTKAIANAELTETTVVLTLTDLDGTGNGDYRYKYYIFYDKATT